MCYRHHEIPTILACLHVNLIITHFLSVCTFLCVMARDAECIFAIFLYCWSMVETFECKRYSNLNINTAFSDRIQLQNCKIVSGAAAS